MVDERASKKRRGFGLLVSMALVGALLVPLAVVSTAAPGATQQNCSVAQGGECCIEAGATQGYVCCPESFPEGVTQAEINNVCCADELVEQRGLAQGGRDVGVKCCPNGEFGHWQWGGYAGQNLSYCDAPPYEPPATAPPPSVSPATSAPKKAAAAAKPTFTG